MSIDLPPNRPPFPPWPTNAHILHDDEAHIYVPPEEEFTRDGLLDRRRMGTFHYPSQEKQKPAKEWFDKEGFRAVRASIYYHYVCLGWPDITLSFSKEYPGCYDSNHYSRFTSIYVPEDVDPEIAMHVVQERLEERGFHVVRRPYQITVRVAEVSVIRADATGWPHQPVLRCPVCQSENTHIVGARISQDTTEVVAGRDTFDVRAIENPSPSRRGSEVAVTLQCEKGWHVTDVCLRFHKGNVFVEVEKRHEGQSLDEGLWRD